jgi:hypothetical protein
VDDSLDPSQISGIEYSTESLVLRSASLRTKRGKELKMRCLTASVGFETSV